MLLKLKELLLDYFVPPQYVELIETRSIYDAPTDTWLVPGLDLAFNNRMLHGPDGFRVAASARTFHRRDPMHLAYTYTRGMMGGMGVGGRFDPTAASIPPEMRAAIEAAVTNQYRTGPRTDVYETYPEVPEERQPGRGKGRPKR